MSEQEENKKDINAAEQTNAETAAAFQVVNEGFSTREAIEEAKRCLHCKIPQCRLCNSSERSESASKLPSTS